MVINIPEIFLVKQFLSGRNDFAFIKLYNLHTKTIFRLAMQLTAGNVPVAGDIVQKAWMITFENSLRLSSNSQLKSSLKQALINCSREYYHKRKYYMLIHDDFSEKPESGISENAEQALSMLPVGYRHVFVLHDIYGYKHKEISELLQITEGISGSQLFNARKDLRQLLPAIFSTKPDHYLEWGDAEIKIFRSAYKNIDLPEELREKVKNKLFDEGLIHTGYYGFSLRNQWSIALFGK
ncbi:MAG: polymerase, sigma-24 subunit, subfamily [Chitinophagaceae bacterium]|nr:polymerase, sigma-24 subunit, subfamily [Chitinophagaceae bacterium]